MAISILGSTFGAPVPASAHHTGPERSGPAFDGRIAGRPDFQRFGKQTRTFDAKRRVYVVRRPGAPPVQYHVDPAPEPAADVVGARAATTQLPPVAYNLAPVCAEGGHRIIPVWSHPPGVGTPNAAEVIRMIMRRMNWKIRQQSVASSNGTRPLSMRVACNAAGQITVKEQVTTSNDEVTILNAAIDTYGSAGLYQSVKYLVFRDGPSPAGAAGIAFYPDDALKSASDDPDVAQPNLNRSLTLGGVVWNPYWQSYTPLHELTHLMGGTQSLVSVPAPFSTPAGHCTDGIDLLCYQDAPSLPVPYSETACPANGSNETSLGMPMDCNYDTYFDAMPEPGEWLDRYWNVGGRENPFLTDTGYTELHAFSTTPAGQLTQMWQSDGISWNGPQNLGSAAAPHPVSPLPGSVAVYWRGTDNDLWHAWYTAGVWHAPLRLTTSHSMASEPSVVVAANGLIQAFWKGANGSVWKLNQLMAGTNLVVSGVIAGSAGSAPHAIYRGASITDVYWRGTDNNLYRWFDGISTAPQKLTTDGLMASDPYPATPPSGDARVFWRTTDGKLAHWMLIYASGFGAYYNDVGPMASAPHPVYRGNGIFDVYWRDTDNNLRHRWWTGPPVGGMWNGPQTLTTGGPMASDPDPVSIGNDETVHVFWKGTAGNLWHTSWDTFVWRTNSLPSGTLASDPKGVYQ